MEARLSAPIPTEAAAAGRRGKSTACRPSIPGRSGPTARAVLAGVVLLVAPLAGCGSPRPDLPPAPPHGGTAYVLPGGGGFVEVLRQDAPERPGQTQLVVYFLDARREPLRPAPTSASFRPKARNATPVSLKPTGDADPTRSGGLASESFGDPGEIAGVLSAMVGDRPVSVAINIR
jgi:hypothetical protein